MQSNIIKLPDIENMHYHHFCSSCHYELFGIDIGVYTSLFIIAILLGIGILASLIFPQKIKK